MPAKEVAFKSVPEDLDGPAASLADAVVEDSAPLFGFEEGPVLVGCEVREDACDWMGSRCGPCGGSAVSKMPE